MNTKSISFLLGFFFTGSACGLGLGDLNVRSHLGEPLRVTVKILDAPKGLEADCFSLRGGNDAQLPDAGNARIALEHRKGETMLVIASPQTINDPVLLFAVVSECADRLRRDYVVLLDPPPVNEPVTVPVEQVASEPATPRQNLLAGQSPRARTQARTSARLQLAQAGTPRPVASRHRREARKPADSRLILSRGHYTHSDAVDAPMALRLEFSLPDLSRPRPQQALASNDLSDENTALTRKLAHLETQIATLQKLNSGLEAARAHPAVAQPVPKTRDEPSQWQIYLLGLGLLAGGVALAAWLRRRGRHIVLEAESALWAPPMPPEERASPEVHIEPESVPAASRIVVPRAPNFSQSPQAEGTEVKEDILDQAEVYVAHGHANLAIHLLQEHLREAPTESPVPWLLLLDLLKRDGLEADYTETCGECQRHFNVNLSASSVSKTEDSSGIESYPHVLAQLEKVWGKPEAEVFLNDLIYDHRGGTRLGFEPGAYRDIVLLRTIAQEHALSIAA